MPPARLLFQAAGEVTDINKIVEPVLKTDWQTAG
jgi:hypothetical protein